jgi:glucose-1-phosphate thymidylyltransferase
MTGVVLAGGEGTRLRPVTEVTNKHLLPVYDRPMIYYPLKTLKEMGCESVVLVTGGEHLGGFAELLKNGNDIGMDIIYRVQENAEGIAQALSRAEGLVKGLFPVILGDNYFSQPPPMPDEPTLFTKEVADPERFGVYQNGQIVEKPTIPASNQAVTGLYVYDERVFSLFDKIKPSDRGEYEITDINNYYLKLGAKVVEMAGDWFDMGTFDSLLRATNYIHDNR